MISIFWRQKDAQEAFSKWMEQTSQSPWTWAGLDINPEQWGQRRVVVHQSKNNYALEWLAPQKLILQSCGQNLFRARPTQNQGPNFVNAAQDILFEWSCLAPRPRLEQEIEQIDEALLEQEDRALTWLKTSFQVIEKALNECETPRDPKAPSILQAKFFAGLPPRPKAKDKNAFEWRLILFDIDFQIIFREDARVEVKVFRSQNDPKKSAQGRPDLHALFALRRREVYDLFVQEINLIAKACFLKAN